MRIKVVDSTLEIPIEEFAVNENVSIETIQNRARQGKIQIIEKEGQQFVNATSPAECRNEKNACFLPVLSFEIPIKLTKKD